MYAMLAIMPATQTIVIGARCVTYPVEAAAVVTAHVTTINLLQLLGRDTVIPTCGREGFDAPRVSQFSV